MWAKSVFPIGFDDDTRRVSCFEPPVGNICWNSPFVPDHRKKKECVIVAQIAEDSAEANELWLL